MSWLNDATTVMTAEQKVANHLAGLETQARNKRDKLLRECDYIVMPDYPKADKSAWETYRQQLRDITEQSGFPESIIWPDPPTE